ncbi:hypothetical protein GX51_07872 [Blastomyces parvus]|uniref:Pleiotropic ABC efflux transporter N-terminal domain-containing protein n=1 Tax=Blastomyces parvus TaxID=2060905 RepID=A0A2B7WI95_9EURO|nr:hypothetical protein GX51_07872 [Blastomyces parvus]
MYSKGSQHTLGIDHGKENEAEALPSNHDGIFHTISSITIDSNGAPKTDDSGMTEVQVKGLVDLARSMSHASAQSSTCTLHSDSDINPFINSESNPELNSHNEKFNLHKWMKSILHITSRDSECYPCHTMYGIVKCLAGFDQKICINILCNFKGLVKSGELLVVLSCPERCSTFLKTLAGETHDLYLREDTLVEYQGISWKQMHKNFWGEAIYQTETETHFTHLTAGDTLYFAAQAHAPANQLSDVSWNQYVLHMCDVVMVMLNLSHTVNTKIKNEYISGVSGDERKHISITETTLCRSSLQYWDNSTQSLDSAITHTVVESLHLSTRYASITAIVAIYQASQVIYDIFDKAMMLYEERQIYFENTINTKKYFVDMSFYCLDRQTTGDFLTSLTNPEE